MSKQKRSVSKYYPEKMKSENEVSLTSCLLSFAGMTLCSWSCYRDGLTYEQAENRASLKDKRLVQYLRSWLPLWVPLFLSDFALLWVCHSGRLAFEVLISTTSCYPSVVKWYVRTRACSHWRVCLLLSSQTTHLTSLPEPLDGCVSSGHSCSAWPTLPTHGFLPYSPLRFTHYQEVKFLQIICSWDFFLSSNW